MNNLFANLMNLSLQERLPLIEQLITLQSTTGESAVFPLEMNGLADAQVLQSTTL